MKNKKIQPFIFTCRGYPNEIGIVFQWLKGEGFWIRVAIKEHVVRFGIRIWDGEKWGDYASDF